MIDGRMQEWNGTMGTSTAAIALSDATPSGEFNVFFSKPGQCQISGSHGNQTWLNAPPITFTAQ
jgi:hypothetical protein